MFENGANPDTSVPVGADTENSPDVFEQGLIDKLDAMGGPLASMERPDLSADDEPAPKDDSLPDELTQEQSPNTNVPHDQKPEESIPDIAPPAKEEPSQPEELYEFNGQRFTKAQLVEGFKVYHQRAQEMDAYAQELQRQKTEVDAAKNAPERIILDAFKSNPNLKERFINEILATEDDGSEIKNNLSVEELHRQVVSLNERLAAREENERRIREHMTVQAEQDRRTAVLTDVAQYAYTRAEQLGLGRDMAEEIGQQAVSAHMTGKLALESNQMKAFFDNKLNMFASKLAANRQGYVEQKRSAPPPPPSGGGTPAINKPIGDFSTDLRKAVANDLAIAFGNLK